MFNFVILLDEKFSIFLDKKKLKDKIEIIDFNQIKKKEKLFKFEELNLAKLPINKTISREVGIEPTTTILKTVIIPFNYSP